MISRPRLLTVAVSSMLALAAPAYGAGDVYAGFPVTVKGYTGKAETSVSYAGQVARQLLHESLKKLSGQGNGAANPDLEAAMTAYFSGTGPGREILTPRSKGRFVIAQSTIDEISAKRDLASKTYRGGYPDGRASGPAPRSSSSGSTRRRSPTRASIR